MFDKVHARDIHTGDMTQHIGPTYIFHLARICSASKFSGKIEEFLEDYLVTETGLETVPFGGRDEDFGLLDTWLDDETAPPRYLLTAPAGRGKSALLVRWLQHLQEQSRVGKDAHDSWNLVFVPISIRFETHRPDIFYEAIAAHLAEILGQELLPTQTDKGVYYADHCRTLASAAVAEGRRILIVLDGIDEALGERFDVRWFPRNPGTHLRLVLSARWQAGDLDSSGWKSRLGWDRDVRVHSRELPVLVREGVRDLLLKMGAPTDVLASRPDIVDRLYCLAEGEPLVLRYYAEDMWAMGEVAPRLTLDDLSQMRPGFGAYFKRWLDDQEHLWSQANGSVDRQRVDAILAILACAHGRLQGVDVRALLIESGDLMTGGRFLEQLKPIQRFIIGLDRPEAETAGYILSHPKLGSYIREEYFDLKDYIQEINQVFVRWGWKTVERLNSNMLRPEETPAYLVQYHTQHLLDAEAPAEAFFELVEYGWLRAWETYEGGYRGFSRDVRLAYEALSRIHAVDQSLLAQRLRCQLALSSIHSIGTNIPWQLLMTAFKVRSLTYWQVEHWLEFKPSAIRAGVLVNLGPYLPVELMPDALAAARSIEDNSNRARFLIALAPHLPAEQSAEVMSDALVAAQSIENNSDRTWVLVDLVPYLPVELIPDALAAARSIEDNSDRAWVLIDLVPHLPAQQSAEVMSDALAAARSIEDNFDRARVLIDLVPHLPAEQSAEVMSDALAAARSIEDNFDRAWVLVDLVPHLPAQQSAEVMSDALAAARSIEDNFDRARVLVDLVPHLPAQQSAEVMSDALAAARSMQNNSDRIWALVNLAPHLPAEQSAEVMSDALAAARSIEDAFHYVQALVALAPHLPAEQSAELIPDALAAARSMQNNSDRIWALVALAPHLPAEQSAEVMSDALAAVRSMQNNSDRIWALVNIGPYLPVELIPDALAAARSIEDNFDRARVLVDLVPHLPAEQSAEVMSDALAAARSIEDAFHRVQALVALVPHLPAEQSAEVMSDALAAARSIEDTFHHVQALVALAPHLPAEQSAELIPDALAAARSIKGNFHRVQALGYLAPHLPAELIPDALAAARSIDDRSHRAQAIVDLVIHLPAEQSAELIPDALAAARSIENGSSRARALGDLAPHLSVELISEVIAEALSAARSETHRYFGPLALGNLAPHLPAELAAEVMSNALAAARSIEDNSDRAWVLGDLIPHLPAELIPEALRVARSIEDIDDHVRCLVKLTSKLSGNLLQQVFEELLNVLPRLRRHACLTAISSFFPFLGECQGLKGLEEVRRAIIDTARWFP